MNAISNQVREIIKKLISDLFLILPNKFYDTAGLIFCDNRSITNKSASGHAACAFASIEKRKLIAHITNSMSIILQKSRMASL